MQNSTEYYFLTEIKEKMECKNKRKTVEFALCRKGNFEKRMFRKQNAQNARHSALMMRRRCFDFSFENVARMEVIDNDVWQRRSLLLVHKPVTVL